MRNKYNNHKTRIIEIDEHDDHNHVLPLSNVKHKINSLPNKKDVRPISNDKDLYSTNNDVQTTQNHLMFLEKGIMDD